MRHILLFMVALLVVGRLCYWSYSENYTTRARMGELRSLQGELRLAHERLALLQDDWAYMNRPERLRVLVEMNEARLGLLPMSPDNFGRISEIPFPIARGPILDAQGLPIPLEELP